MDDHICHPHVLPISSLTSMMMSYSPARSFAMVIKKWNNCAGSRADFLSVGCSLVGIHHWPPAIGLRIGGGIGVEIGREIEGGIGVAISPSICPHWNARIFSIVACQSLPACHSFLNTSYAILPILSIVSSYFDSLGRHNL
jgi:hypothetical protein